MLLSAAADFREENMDFISGDKKSVKTECEIDGKRMRYDGCSSNSKDEADKFYNSLPGKWTYIGSSRTYWIDGKKNSSQATLYHYYVREAASPSASNPDTSGMLVR